MHLSGGAPWLHAPFRAIHRKWMRWGPAKHGTDLPLARHLQAPSGGGVTHGGDAWLGQREMWRKCDIAGIVTAKTNDNVQNDRCRALCRVR
eukprot:gene13187-biopygen18546